MTFFIFTLLFLSFFPSEDREKMTRVIPLQDEQALEVDLEFAAGKMVIGKSENDVLFDGTFYYNKYTPKIEYYVQNKRGTLFLDMNIDRDKDSEDLNVSVNSLDEIGDTEWYLDFSDQIPLDFSIQMGAAEANLQFGGLRIQSLDLESGASDTRLDFREINPIQMRTLVIETGFSEFEASNLLNARFKRMRFDGGVGEYELHFGGTLSEEVYVNIDVSVGSLYLSVPQDVPFRLECDRYLFSSLDVESATENEDEIWYSRNFQRDKSYINFEIDAGVGSISLRRID
jgi:hypothetical protein